MCVCCKEFHWGLRWWNKNIIIWGPAQYIYLEGIPIYLVGCNFCLLTIVLKGLWTHFYWGYSPHTTNKVSDTNWVSYNVTQFWQYLREMASDSTGQAFCWMGCLRRRALTCISAPFTAQTWRTLDTPCFPSWSAPTFLPSRSLLLRFLDCFGTLKPCDSLKGLTLFHRFSR